MARLCNNRRHVGGESSCASASDITVISGLSIDTQPEESSPEAATVSSEPRSSP